MGQQDCNPWVWLPRNCTRHNTVLELPAVSMLTRSAPNTIGTNKTTHKSTCKDFGPWVQPLRYCSKQIGQHWWKHYTISHTTLFINTQGRKITNITPFITPFISSIVLITPLNYEITQKKIPNTWKDSSEERATTQLLSESFIQVKEFSEWCPTNEFTMYNGRKAITVPFGM